MTRSETAGVKIDRKTASIEGWRGRTLAAARKAILAADPAIEETLKWAKPTNPAGVPVWEKGGILCTGEVYRDKIKLTFAKGAKLDNPAKMFNASLTGNARRAIDFCEGDQVDAAGLTKLVREAIAANGG